MTAAASTAAAATTGRADMPLHAFDGASPFDLAAAAHAGGIICTTYIRGTPGGMAHADAARVAAIRAHGMGAHPNWESTADFFGTCTVPDANWAGRDAHAAARACGYPDNGTIRISFSFDFDVPPSRFPEMGVKVDAVRAGLAGHYGLKIYGQQALIDWLTSHGHIDSAHWLMMSTFGQPYHPRSPNVCVVQGHDADGNWIQDTNPVPNTDINTVTQPGLVGCWWPPGSPYATGGFTVTDVQTILAAIAALQADVDAKIASLRTDAGGQYQMLVQQIGEATHPKTDSLRNAVLGAVAPLPTNAEMTTALSAVPTHADLAEALTHALTGVGITLTDEQAQQAAVVFAAAVPKSQSFRLTGTFDPVE